VRLRHALGQRAHLGERGVRLFRREAPLRHTTIIGSLVGAGQRPDDVTARDGTNVRLALWSALVLGVAALGYAGRSSGGKPPRDALFLWSTAASEAVLFAVILVLVLAIAAGLPKREVS
jgi:hypothetical protein